MDREEPQVSDTLISTRDPQSSAVILDALAASEKEFRSYDELCRRIDNIYSGRSDLGATLTDLGMTDQEYDTFWAAMEVAKAAIYAKPPQVVAKPRYSDATPADKVVAELIERVVNSEFERISIDQQFKEVRDDLTLLSRGVMRVGYENKDGRKAICVDHVDRMDYRHEPVRYWRELGWQAYGAWLTEREMRKRFSEASGEAYQRATYLARNSHRDDGASDDSLKCLVWEVESKTDNKVYWVTEGVDVILDEASPDVDLSDFWSSPRPAYGTLRRRTLVPVPDWVRYARLLDQINLATSKIYTLLDRVKMMGFIAGGGDVATAVQTTLTSNDAMTIVPVPGAALMASGGGSALVQWLPLVELATAIQGLIEARAQLFADFDRLSGISDIMRGETQANETLGAQRIKTQYGSIRVKDKTEEIVRLARDTARVAVEIICAKFDKDTLLEIAQMEIPTRREVDKDIEALKKAAQEETKALGKKAVEAAQQAQQSGQEVDPAQAQQMLQQAQMQLAEKYAPEFQRLNNTVVVEDVMKIIKDKRARALIIDIETDSTIMVDEIAEKQMRNELLGAFSGAIGAMQPLFALGESGVKIAVEILDFTMQPYVRNNRQLRAYFDELVEQAPEIAARMAAQQDGGESEGLAEAQKALAAAEQTKADAAMAGVQAKAQLDKAEMQRKMAEMQMKAQADQQKAMEAQTKLELQLQKQQQEALNKDSKTRAEIDLMRAKIAEILNSIGLDERKQQLSEYQAAEQSQVQRVDQAMAIEGQQTEREFRAEEAERAARGEDRADRQQDFSEQSGERQMTLAEQQAMREGQGNGDG